MKLFLFNNDEKLIGTVSPLEGIQNEEINKIQTIECTVVYSELIEKASYIGHKDYSDNRIFHLYKIDHVTKTSTTDVKIVGVHMFFDDMESDGYIKDFRPTNREVVGVLTTILEGSRWQLGSVNVQRNYTGNFYYVTRKEAISKLIEATQIEIKPRLEFSRGKITGRYLDVFTRLGARNGKVFVHGRDLLTVSEKKSQGAIYTAVVGRGKGEETDTGGYGRRISFKDVEWRRTSGQPVDKPVGQEYVEIPAMTRLYGFEKGTKPRIKIVEFQDETDKEKLLRLSYEWLEKNSRMQVEYSAKVLNVGNLELGDTVGIFNPKLGIKYETRVFKVKRNLVDNKLTEFGIGDKVTTSPFSRTIELAKEMKNFQDDTVYWLDKIRERLSDKLINEDGYNYDLKADNEYKVPAGYYSFDKPIDQNPTKVVYMGAGKIAIANSKKPTGEWNWKTFLDGTGATLDLINTGVLRAGRIQSADGSSYWDLDTGEFHLQQSAITEAVNNAVNGKVNEIVGEVKKNLPTKEELKGKSSYLHKKYSDFEDGRNMDNNSNRKYIGIYTGDKATAPTSASEYSWTKIRGEDGARGRDGERGRDGTNGHSLTASLWLTGGYVNNVINDVKLNLKVFYDGREIRDFSSVITYKGGNFSSWQTKENPTVTSYNAIDYTFWSNGEKDGSTLFALATVTYNGLQAVADTRLDNVPDVRLLSETIKKYKTFESTLDGFTSVVGEIDTKILSSAYFKNNLNYEDVEKTGNDLYFNAKENLVANEYYTILADLDNVPANQQTYMYGASDGGDKKVIQNGLNYWVVKYPDNRGNVNLYPLGANTKVKNVKIYKGDFRVKKDDEKARENLYSSSATDSTYKFIQLHLNKNKINGNVYTVKFDASGYSNGDRWDIYNRVGYDGNNLTQVFKDKDNEFTFTINDDTNPNRMYIRMIEVGNTKISNVEIYDVSTEYVKNSQVSKLESSIKQTKDEIDLKVSKDNVIASINASVETTGEGPAQGVVKINADKVDISGVLSAYTGEIGGFRIGQNPNDGGFWLTGTINFDCGINPGHNVGSRGAQLWAAWGDKWTKAGPNAWWVNAQGVMTCKATPTFHNGMEVYGRYIDTHGNDIQGDKTGGGKTTVVWWSQINKANSTSSDRRLKTDIKPTKVKALDMLNNIEMVEFNWKKDGKFEKIGAIAQQVQSIEESFVVQDMDDKQTYNDYLRISYYNTIPYLIKAVQELSEENNNLKLRLQKLEDKINGNL
jgi:phage minor structural protein, N-terminal domain protein|uniref:Tail protein n=1 Tax=Siphoviridae sp. ctSP74 TaxID=2826343 RepID=A0A8S5NRB9_9CAUD|nr:MAG TPA: tail protein [Siphoviridae sp. ctSP74]